MIKRLYKRWNWEFDFGEEMLPNDGPLPATYAIAYFDYRGSLYRVVVRVELSIESDNDPSDFGMFVYDYFCDETGRILQKRSFDMESEDGIIVDMEYNDEKGEVTETAWSPIHGFGKVHTRKQVPRVRA